MENVFAKEEGAPSAGAQQRAVKFQLATPPHVAPLSALRDVELCGVPPELYAKGGFLVA